MRRHDLDPAARLGVDPPLRIAPAGKYERVRPAAIDHGELELAVERRARRRLPALRLHALGQEAIERFGEPVALREALPALLLLEVFGLQLGIARGVGPAAGFRRPRKAVADLVTELLKHGNQPRPCEISRYSEL